MASNNVSSTSNTETHVCSICGKYNTFEKLSKVSKKGKTGLIKLLTDSGKTSALASLNSTEKPLRCKDGICKTYLYNESKNTTRKRKQEEAAEKEEEKLKRRRTGDAQRKILLYKDKCILCNQDASIYLNNPAKRDYTRPDSASWKDLMKRLNKAADERLAIDTRDKWAVEVKGRLSGINDLVAEETLLHKLCSTKFQDMRSYIAEKGGRPVDEGREHVVEKLCVWLNEEMEHNLFTLDLIYKQYLSFDTSDNRSLTYTKRYLKEKLQRIYGDSIYFTNQERRADVLCFKDTTANIIRDYQKNADEDDEKTRIIKAAAKFIKNDIALTKFDSINYPSIADMTTLENQLQIVPSSLKLFLEPILRTEKRIAAWSQGMMKICRPRSGVLPFTMRLGLQIDHRFGSKWLIDELHSFGFSESYHEVGNYKYCYLRNKLKSKMDAISMPIIEEVDDVEEERSVDNELQKIPEDEVVEAGQGEKSNNTDNSGYKKNQYAGDNLDLNIISINGNKPFHAMGLIKIASKEAAITSTTLNSKIPRVRLSAKEKAEVLKAGDVQIKPCADPKKSGIDKTKFTPLETLLKETSKTPAVINGEDIVWAAGWIIKKSNSNFSHANWNGWMKSIHSSKTKDANHIEYQPIIDGDPNDYSTIYTTLLQCIELEDMPVVTFDLPLWLKAVDIIQSKDLEVVPRLGGFHLLKSFLGTFGLIFADSGLHDILQLVYPGQLTADSILNGNSYDKAIRAHLLIDATIIQHILPPDTFSHEELEEMKGTLNNAVNSTMEFNCTEYTVTETFRSKIQEKFKQLSNAGRTPGLWALYHYMVDTIKIFIRAERLGDFELHLSCISHRMLHVFAAAGHHHYAKAARLYVQLMLSYETGSPKQKAIIESFKTTGSHVVRYSSYEWSGIWSDLCIEQTLMRTAKSNGGLSGGRFRNGESAHRCWVQTLSHLSLINRLSSEEKKKSIHRDLGATQRKADEKAILAINQWLEEMDPFDQARDKSVLISFSTGFYSKGDDGVNPEKSLTVGKKIQMQLDGLVPSSKIETKNKVQPLSTLRKNTMSSQANTQVNALMYFNRLVVFAQRDCNLASALEYELGPFPMSLFSAKDQLMYEADKASFAQSSLKQNVSFADISKFNVGCLVIDGGWLLRQCTWEKGATWKTIGSNYAQYVLSMGKHAKKIEVVFDGYSSSTKDHTHRRRQKQFCHDMVINADNIPYTSKEKFLSNGKNKTELVKFIGEMLSNQNVSVTFCSDDADTSIVQSVIDHAKNETVEVRAEDNDILIMLVHHMTNEHHHMILTTSKGRYSIREVKDSLTELEKKYLLLCHAFTGCDTVSSIYGFSKEKLFSMLTSTDLLHKQFGVLCNPTSAQEQIKQSGIEIFQFIYNSLGTPLAKIRLHRYNKQSKAGVIRPEGLPPTDSAAAHHSLRAHLQLQDWLVLRSMSRDALNYGWLRDARGYEPIVMTDPMAPDELLKFISCNCKTTCSTQRCSCKKNNVKCISACGHCHGMDCKNVASE